MTTTFFSISVGARWAGFGLIAPAARYASIRWRGASRLVRRHPSARDWETIQAALADTLQSEPFESSHPLSRVFIGDEPGMTIRWLAGLPLKTRDPMTVSGTLDRLLLDRPAGPSLEEHDGHEDSRISTRKFRHEPVSLKKVRLAGRMSGCRSRVRPIVSSS